MNSKTNEEKGITLVSLIITIVIMLILAFVVLNLALGNNGLIRKVQQARENDLIGREKEAIQMSYSKMNIDKIELDSQIEKNYVDEDTYNDDGYWLEENGITDQMQEELKNMNYNTTVGIKEDKMEITFTDSNHIYDVDIDGEIKYDDPNIDINDPIVSINNDFFVRKSGAIEYDLSEKTNGFITYDSKSENAVGFNNKIKKVINKYVLDNKGNLYQKNIRNSKIYLDNFKDYDEFSNMYISDIFSSAATRNYIFLIDNNGILYKYDDELVNLSEEYNLNNIKVKYIYENHPNIYIIDNDGKLYISGENDSGQLGNGTYTNNYKNNFYCVNNSEALKNVKFDKVFSSTIWDIYAIDSEGNIYAWGENYAGELGIGDGDKHNVPQKITINDELKTESIKNIDFFDANSMYILTDSGDLYIAGKYNLDGNYTQNNTFKKVNDDGVLSGRKIENVLPNNNIYILDKDGNLYERQEIINPQDGSYTYKAGFLNDSILDGKKVKQYNEYNSNGCLEILTTDGKFYSQYFDFRNQSYNTVCESDNAESPYYGKIISGYYGSDFSAGYNTVSSEYFLTNTNEVIFMRQSNGTPM